jgi:glucokinase
MILASDIGGTSCRLLLARADNGEIVAESSYPSADFPNLEAAIARFLEAHHQPAREIERAVLALAGPVTRDCVALTNLPWLVCRKSLQQQLPEARIEFLNDFQAAALGVLEVEETKLLPIQPVPESEGERKLVMGAGTGMGVAYLHPGKNGYHAWSTEAGHMGFAPADSRQWELHEALRRKYGRASWERVLSGPGLADLHAFLAGTAETWQPPAIIDAANEGDDATAREAVELFARLYGSYCGDLALAWQPRGGIYLTGGVTTHIAQWLTCPPFLEAFADKGRMSPLMESFPIHIVMEPRTGLLGTLHHALNQV